MLEAQIPTDTIVRWKTSEIGVRQGANRNEVRPRTAEQGPHLWGCDPVAGCLRTMFKRVLMRTSAVASPRGPYSALRCAHLVRIRNTAWRRFSSAFRQVISGTAR